MKVVVQDVFTMELDVLLLVQGIVLHQVRKLVVQVVFTMVLDVLLLVQGIVFVFSGINKKIIRKKGKFLGF